MASENPTGAVNIYELASINLSTAHNILKRAMGFEADTKVVEGIIERLERANQEERNRKVDHDKPGVR